MGGVHCFSLWILDFLVLNKFSIIFVIYILNTKANIWYKEEFAVYTYQRHVIIPDTLLE